MIPNEPLEDELNKQFPKGDKARGKALVINAIANIELEKLKEQHDKELLDVKDVIVSYEASDNRLNKENQKLKKQIELILRKNGNKLGVCDWTSYCATTTNRNQCSKKNCTAYSICLIKKLKEMKK